MNRKKPHFPPSEPCYPPKSSSVDSTANFQYETANGGEMTMHQNTRRNDVNCQQVHLPALHAQTQSYPAYQAHPDSNSQYAPAVAGGPPGIGSPTSDSSTWGDGYTDENRPSTTTVRPPPSSFDPKEHLPYNGLSSPETKYPSPRDDAKQALSSDGKALSPMKDSQLPLSRSPPDSQATLTQSYEGKPQTFPPAPANGAKNVAFKDTEIVFQQASRAGHRRDDSNSSNESAPNYGPETPAHMATNASLPSDDGSNESKTVQNNGRRTSSKRLPLQAAQTTPPIVDELGPPARAFPTSGFLHTATNLDPVAKELQNIVGVYTHSSPDESQRFSQKPATEPPCSNMVVVINGFGNVNISGDGATITCEQFIRDVLRSLQRQIATAKMKNPGTNHDVRQLSYLQLGNGQWKLVLRALDK